MMPRIGIGWDTTGQMTIAHPNPIEQVYDSVTSTLNTIDAVASPKSDVKLQHLSGPVGIVRIYYLLFESDRGWQLALWFSVILNVNLAILNMLPIPVLDGGHIVLALVEAVRRKPVNIRVLEIVQTGCAVLIIGYIAYISFFDVGDWLGEKRTDDEPVSGGPGQPESIGRAGARRAHFQSRALRALLSFRAALTNMSRLSYCDDLLHYERRLSREVMVGRVGVGGANPIRVQSMITCDTMDTEASIAQTHRAGRRSVARSCASPRRR